MTGIKILDRSQSAEATNSLADTFIGYFHNYGARQDAAVSVTSGIDPTVRFIGSHISVMKPYFGEVELPENGVTMVQPCIRTKNLVRLGEPDFFPNWGSHFVSIGGLFHYRDLPDVCSRIHGFFSDELQIPVDGIVARVSSADKDLLDVCSSIFPAQHIETDTMQPTYYQHKIGMDNVVGRNFNIALRHAATGQLADIGNVIVLEKDGLPHSVELAFGVSTTLKQINGMDHVLDCHPVILNVAEGTSGMVRQLEDVIVTGTLLLREGLQPSNKDNRTRILKKYLAMGQKIASDLGLDAQECLASARSYEILEYGNESAAAEALFPMKSADRPILPPISLRARLGIPK